MAMLNHQLHMEISHAQELFSFMQCFTYMIFSPLRVIHSYNTVKQKTEDNILEPGILLKTWLD